MATHTFCKHINWFRRLPALAYLQALVAFLGCTDLKQPRPNVTPIYVDETYYPAIKACAEVYKARYQLPVEIKQVTIKRALQAFLLDSTNTIIGHFTPDSNFVRYFQKNNHTLNFQPVFYSAVVALSHQQKAMQWSENQLFLVDSNDYNTRAFLSTFSANQIIGFGRTTNMMEYATQQPKAIILIDAYALSQYKQIYGWHYKDILDILPVVVQKDSIWPTPKNIVSGEYPYFKVVNFIQKPENIGETERFIKFLFHRDAQRIFEKEGLIPRLNYPRVVNTQ